MEHAPIHTLVVIALLQLCRAQSTDVLTEWFAANDINDTNYSPKPITELFSTETSFSPENPIVVLQSTSPTNRGVFSPTPTQDPDSTFPPNVIPLSTESPSSQSTSLQSNDTQPPTTPQQISTISEGSSTITQQPSSTESTLTSANTQGFNQNQLPRTNGNIQNVRQNQPQPGNTLPPQLRPQNVAFMLPPQLGNRNFIQGQMLPPNSGQPNYIVLYQQAPQNIQNMPPQMPPQIFAPPAQMSAARPPNMVRNRPITQPVGQPPNPNQFPQANAIPRFNMAPPNVNPSVQQNNQFPINQQIYNQTFNNQQQVNPLPNNQPTNFQQPNDPQINNQPFNNQAPIYQQPNNQPPNNQLPTNQPRNNQLPTNQPPNNQFPTNQPPNKQFPTNQPPNKQFPITQPPNSLPNQIPNNVQASPNYVPNGQAPPFGPNNPQVLPIPNNVQVSPNYVSNGQAPPFVPNNSQVLPPRPRQRNRVNGKRPNNRGRNRQGPNAFPCQLNQTTARTPTATQKSPVITIRLTPSRNAKPELKVDPSLTTIRASTVQPSRQNSQINSRNYERCLSSCRDRKDRICAAPERDIQINPDTLKGFPSMCHMACHNAFRANPIYGRVANGRCGKLRTRIQTVDKTKVRRDELNKSQYTIISNVPGTVVELAQ